MAILGIQFVFFSIGFDDSFCSRSVLKTWIKRKARVFMFTIQRSFTVKHVLYVFFVLLYGFDQNGIHHHIITGWWFQPT